MMDDNKDEIVTSVNSYMVHKKSVNRIFGEGNTTVSLEDNGGGAFLVLSQCSCYEMRIQLDFEEFDKIVEAVELLRKSL